VLPKQETPLKMVKQATKRRRTQAGKEERYMQKVDRAVSRYGASAVSKYFQPGVDRTGGYYGRFAGRGAELKFFDTATSFSIDTSPEVPATGQLVLIPQGVTESTRVGRKCVIRSIQGRWDLRFNPGAGAKQIRPMRSIWSWTSSAMALLPRTRTCSCRAWHSVLPQPREQWSLCCAEEVGRYLQFGCWCHDRVQRGDEAHRLVQEVQHPDRV